MYRISLVVNSPRYNLMVAALYKQLLAVFYPPQNSFSLLNCITFVIFILLIISRGGFEAKPSSTPLYFKGFLIPVPSLSQGILFIKLIMRVTLYTAIRRESTVYGNNRTRYKTTCVIVRKPHKRADKVGDLPKFLHRRCRKDFARSCRRRAVFVE